MSKTTSNKMNNNDNKEDQGLANKYQQKTDKQHILDNPDTYIGSVEKVEANLWIINNTEVNETKADDKIV